VDEPENRLLNVTRSRRVFSSQWRNRAPMAATGKNLLASASDVEVDGVFEPATCNCLSTSTRWGRAPCRVMLAATVV